MHIDKQFSEAKHQWDLTCLYGDLSSIKGGNLTPVEKLHLRGLLCGYSPTEIALKLHKNAKGVEVDLCKTIYQYVKGLVNRENGGMKNWRNIYHWLEEAGYKTDLNKLLSLNSLLPDTQIRLVNVNHNQRGKVTFEFNIQVALPLKDL